MAVVTLVVAVTAEQQESIDDFDANLLSTFNGTCAGCHRVVALPRTIHLQGTSTEIINNFLSNGNNWNNLGYLTGAHPGSGAFVDIETEYSNWLTIQNNCE